MNELAILLILKVDILIKNPNEIGTLQNNTNQLTRFISMTTHPNQISIDVETRFNWIESLTNHFSIFSLIFTLEQIWKASKPNEWFFLVFLSLMAKSKLDYTVA